MKHIKNLIVGTGFSGATLANKIAVELDEDIVVIDIKIILPAIVTIIMTIMVFVFINMVRISFIQI
jgi:hypothetical protein